MPKPVEGGNRGGKPFRKEKSIMDTIFSELQKTTSRLNDTADAANELIRETNDRLGQMGAGVTFSADGCYLKVTHSSRYNEDEDCEEEAGFTKCVLGYAKIYGSWQLVVEEQHYVPGGSGISGDYNFVGEDVEPLLNSDRELRIEAASMLPRFLRAYTLHLAKLADKLTTEEDEG